MAEFIYAMATARIKDFLSKIQTSGTPDKLSVKTLSSLGFKNSNDRRLIKIMNELGFISSDGSPTDRWGDYRNKSKAKAVLADGIREHYAELYKTYPDAHQRDNEALRNFFSSHTKVGEKALSLIVSTFRALAELADFSAQEGEPEQPLPAEETAVASLPSIQLQKQGYVININIQLALPESSDAAVYEALFTSMKKHLLS